MYEPVKPRQRRKRTESISVVSVAAPSFNSNNNGSPTKSSSPEQWPEESQIDSNSIACKGDSVVGDILSPLDGTFDSASLFNFDSSLDIPITSPIDSIAFDFPAGLGLEVVDNPNPEEDTQANAGSTIVALSTSAPLSSDLALIAPCSTGAPLLNYCMPSYIEFSDKPNRRALVDHFCNVLSHLIVFREECGNPFQQLVLPLSFQSSAVTNALYALASAHLEYRGVENPEKSVYFHSRAIQGLSNLIEQDGKANRNELLAAIMLLIYYEVLVQNGRSNIVDGHLKGAMTVLGSAPDPTDATGVFLERAFRFYDVIAALSFGTAPLSTAPAAGCLAPFPPVDASTLPVLGNVDTLLGMATTLWPIMHRLSNLPALKHELESAIAAKQTSKVAVLRTEFETTSQAIEVALKQWQPTLPSSVNLPDEGDDNMSDEQARLLSTLNNALAYRHSALVYLYRSVYGHPRGHHLVQTHAHVALTHCVATVSHQGPMGALLWPLFVAACEAISDSDRTLARTAFSAVERRQGMANIGRAWEIVQEVWRRADVLATTPGSPCATGSKGREGRVSHLWRKVSQEMGITIVFG